MIEEVGNWLWGVVGLGVAVSAYATGLFNYFVPSPQRLHALVIEIFEKEHEKGDRLTFLMCWLENDHDGSQTRHVAAALEKQDGTEVIRTSRVLRVKNVGLQSLALSKAFGTGRKWLHSRNADVLIWGEVVRENETLRLRYLAPDDTHLGVQTYGLQNTILPKDFDDDIAMIPLVLALAEVRPLGRSKVRCAKALLSNVEKLETLMNSLLERLAGDQIGRCYYAFGLAAGVVGSDLGETEWLRKSISASEKAAEVFEDLDLDSDKADARQNLGIALTTLGRMSDSSSQIEEGIEALRLAQKDLGDDTFFLQWLSAEKEIGRALAQLGRMENGTSRLLESVSTYTALLTKVDRETAPQEWASVQIGLGDVLRELAQREGSSTRLNEAEAACRLALELVSSHDSPGKWSTCHNDLGIVLTLQGLWNQDLELVRAAIAAYREALKVRSRDNTPIDWVSTQSNLGKALRILGEGYRDKGFIEEAITTFRNVHTVWTKEDHPKHWALALMDLGNAHAALAELQGESQYFKDAVKMLQDALTQFDPSQNESYWFAVQLNIANIYRMLGEKDKDAGISNNAVSLCQDLLSKITRETDFGGWLKANLILASCLANIGRLNRDSNILNEAAEGLKKIAILEKTEFSRSFIEIAARNLNGVQRLLDTIGRYQVD